MSDFISLKSIKSLLSRLANPRGKRKKEISKIRDVFDDPVFLSKYYVAPDCQHHNPADSDDNEAVSNIRMPVFSFINSFFEGEIASKAGGNQLFILSDAGMGKTSLLLMLKLVHLNAFWPKGYRCDLCKLGSDTVQKINEIEDQEDVILLLDALDEDPEGFGNVDKRLKELLGASRNFKRVVITCRTQFFPLGERNPFDHVGKMKIGRYTCPTLFLAPFGDKQIEEYLKKRFPRNLKKRNKARNITRKMHHMRCRPLLLSYIDTFLDSKIKEWNEFTIYEALVGSWLEREENKYRKLREHVTKDTLQLVCVNIAVYMQQKGSRLITLEELGVLKEQDCLFANVEKIDIGGRSLLNRNSDGAYRFSHYTIQEFLIAYGLVHGMIGHMKNPLRITHEIMSFLKLFDFQTFGLNQLNLENLDLQGLSFKRTSMSGVCMQGSHLDGVGFEEANLSSARLDYVNLNNSRMVDANLNGASLRSSTLQNANLRNANLDRANLYRADLSQCNLEMGDLLKTNLRGANLMGAKLCGATCVGVNLLDANVEDTDFTLADFRGAEIYETVLPRTMDLKKANFWWLAVYDKEKAKMLGLKPAHVNVCISHLEKLSALRTNRKKFNKFIKELQEKFPEAPTD